MPTILYGDSNCTIVASGGFKNLRSVLNVYVPKSKTVLLMRKITVDGTEVDKTEKITKTGSKWPSIPLESSDVIRFA
jgi:hypothetical protein